MIDGDRWLLLVARPGVEVLGACRAAADFLTFRLRHGSPDSGMQSLCVIAVWVDGSLVDIDPDALGRSPGGIRIGESVGVNGIWSLYWLDVDVGTTGADIASVREQLISALMAARCPSNSMPLCAPVVDPTRQSVDAIRADTWQLAERFPGLIATPIVWNRTTGIVRNLHAHDGEP